MDLPIPEVQAWPLAMDGGAAPNVAARQEGFPRDPRPVRPPQARGAIDRLKLR